MKKDPLNVAYLKQALGELGYELYYFPEVDTTMRVIEEKAKKHKNLFAVALADHQTKGRGRESRSWVDRQNGSLMFSVLIPIQEQTIATFADLVALSLCQVLQKVTGKNLVKIKYPNDLVVDDRKLGGVLVKNIYNMKNEYKGTNLGIGLNIHYTSDMLAKFSTDYLATSLDICSNSFVKRQNLLIEILRGLRYLRTEVEAIEANPKARAHFEKKWKATSSIMGRRVAILKGEKTLTEGLVIDSGMGRGIELKTSFGDKWFSLFETDMKLRVLN